MRCMKILRDRLPKVQKLKKLIWKSTPQVVWKKLALFAKNKLFICTSCMKKPSTGLFIVHISLEIGYFSVKAKKPLQAF